MNAHAPFRLDSESSCLSRKNVTLNDIIADAEHQLMRCNSAEDFERWAKAWGEPLIERARETSVW